MHQSYQKHFGHPCDFRVSYNFYTSAEGGRMSLPSQGYRSDFWYDQPEYEGYHNMVFMIWPEFEDLKGNIIQDNQAPISISGTASMWIVDPCRRPYHREKIKLGIHGYFMEASRRVAECKVIEVVGLKTNPITA